MVSQRDLNICAGLSDNAVTDKHVKTFSCTQMVHWMSVHSESVEGAIQSVRGALSSQRTGVHVNPKTLQLGKKT